jgi:hypothetical protein
MKGSRRIGQKYNGGLSSMPEYKCNEMQFISVDTPPCNSAIKMVEIYKLSIAPKMKSSYPEWRPTRAQKVICYRSLWRAPLSIQLLHVKSTSALNPTWKKKRPIEISSKKGKN